MKVILMSIQPKWVEKILKREKPIEIRKTAPKEFLTEEESGGTEVYIYCTRSKQDVLVRHDNGDMAIATERDWNENGNASGILNGKVVAKFTLREITKYIHYSVSDYRNNVDLKNACLTLREFNDYIGFNTESYAWHITDLVIFDKPIELGEFKQPCKGEKSGCKGDFDKYCTKCKNFVWNTYEPPECLTAGRIKLTRAPQSWQYVEVDSCGR